MMSGTKYKDEKWLRQKYVDEGLSMSQIADVCGCSYGTIYYWMNKCGIDRRKQPQEQLLTPYTTKDGYVRVDVTMGGEKKAVPIHRLLAVAEHGFDAVKGNDVHHQNEIPWDNRPDNIELLSREDHAGHHNRGENTKYRDEQWLREKYVDEGLLQREIAELCGCSPRTISYWLDKHGVDVSKHHNPVNNIEKQSGGVV